MKRKGFTLIELLGVIILIGIIAVITVPTVRNLIRDAKQKALEKQIDVVLESAKNWGTSNTDLLLEDDSSILVKMNTLKQAGFLENKEIIDPVNNEEMNVCVEIKHNTDFSQYEYIYDEDCFVTNPIIEYTDKCMESSSTKCSNGTKLTVQVNTTEKKSFYVIEDTGTELTLITEQNLGDNVEWYDATGDNSHGPITAVAELKLRTNDWINIPERLYTYSDDGGGSKYKAFTETMRARMITYTEVNTIIDVNNGTMPRWMYENLYNTDGYWTSAAASTSSNAAWTVHYDGELFSNYTINRYNGICPVITIPKSVPIY